MDRAGEDMSATLAELGAGDATAREAVEAVADLQDELDRAATSLEAVVPPADARPAHDRLVIGLRGLADEFDPFREAIAARDEAALADAREVVAASAAGRDIERASEELHELGYELDVESR